MYHDDFVPPRRGWNLNARPSESEKPTKLKTSLPDTNRSPSLVSDSGTTYYESSANT